MINQLFAPFLGSALKLETITKGSFLYSLLSLPIVHALKNKIALVFSNDVITSALLVNTTLSVMTIGIVIVDGITQAMANEKLTPSKAFENVFKVFIYGMIYMFLFQMFDIAVELAEHTYLHKVVTTAKLYLTIWIVLWELQSIGDNIYKKFGKKFAVFYLAEKASIFFKKHITDRLSGTDMCNIQQNENDTNLR